MWYVCVCAVSFAVQHENNVILVCTLTGASDSEFCLLTTAIAKPYCVYKVERCVSRRLINRRQQQEEKLSSFSPLTSSSGA